MTLDPVQFESITDLVGRIRHGIDEERHRDQAADAWEHYLDPLVRDGDRVLEPLDGLSRVEAPVQQAGLQPDPFDAVHALDSGTINPRTFKNGIVLDVAQAAMSATPSDLDLHRARTVVATVHAADETVTVRNQDWDRDDEGHIRRRIFETPDVERDEQAVVHALSLYLAESTHALEHAETVDGMLVLDGPVYPKLVADWLNDPRRPADLTADDDTVGTVLRNYLELVERFVARDVSLVGFVKNNTAKGIVRTLRAKDGLTAPWTTDAVFFSQVLERRERRDGEYRRQTDAITYTNWFVSRVGYDRTFSRVGDALDVDRELDDDAYEVAFFVIYEPRTDTVYRVEAPYAVVADEDRRERITRHLVSSVARESGPPTAISKADDLARISAGETSRLVEQFEERLDSGYVQSYDEQRGMTE